MGPLSGLAETQSFHFELGVTNLQDLVRYATFRHNPRPWWFRNVGHGALACLVLLLVLPADRVALAVAAGAGASVVILNGLVGHIQVRYRSRVLAPLLGGGTRA